MSQGNVVKFEEITQVNASRGGKSTRYSLVHRQWKDGASFACALQWFPENSDRFISERVKKSPR